MACPVLKNVQIIFHIICIYQRINKNIAAMQCPRMHIVNFPSNRAPILCIHTCICYYQPNSLYKRPICIAVFAQLGISFQNLLMSSQSVIS